MSDGNFLDTTGSGGGDASAANQDEQTALLTTIDADTGAIKTATELIDDTVATLGTTTYTEATTKGLTIGAVRRDADTTLVNTTNEVAPLQVDARGALKVEVFSGETLPVSLTSTTVTGTVAVTQSGTWDEVGINDSGNSITVDNDGTFAVQVTSLPASTNTIEVVGDVAHDSAVGGNPVLTAAEARDTNGTVVASGDVVRIAADRYGRLRVVAPKLTLASSNGTPITTATDTSLVSAPSAGNHLRVHRIHATNSSDTPTFVYWRDGAAGTKRYPCYLGTGAVVSLDLRGSWELTTATALYLNTSAAGNVEWEVDYETVTD